MFVGFFLHVSVHDLTHACFPHACSKNRLFHDVKHRPRQELHHLVVKLLMFVFFKSWLLITATGIYFSEGVNSVGADSQNEKHTEGTESGDSVKLSFTNQTVYLH